MYKSNFYLVWASLLMLNGELLFGQKLSFHHIGSDQGMISLPSHNCAIDQFGFFWAATNDGLVRFNGKEIKTFYHQTHPELPSDNIVWVYCDIHNNVWACTAKGLVRLDENRKLIRQVVVPDNPDAYVESCFGDNEGQMFALTGSGAYSLAKNSDTWTKAGWLDTIISNRAYRSIRQFDAVRYLITLPSAGVFLFNTRDKKAELFIPVKGINSVARFDDHSILMSKSGKFELFHVTLADPQNFTSIPIPPFFQPNNLHKEIYSMVRAGDRKVYLSTRDAGLLSLDPSFAHYEHYTHDAVNPATMINDSPRFMVTDSSGNLLITSRDGMSHTNVNYHSVKYINYIRDDRGHVIDSRVNSIAEDKHHNLWIAFNDNVYIYDQEKGSARAIQIPSDFHSIADKLSPVWVERDHNDNMWVGLQHLGIAIFNSDGIFKKFISPDDYPGYEKWIRNPHIIKEGFDGYTYIGSAYGLFRIGHDGFQPDSFADHPAIAPLRHKRIVDILPGKEDLWISTSPRGAAWHYSYEEKKLSSFDMSNGLVSDRIYSLASDSSGNIYVGSFGGFSIIRPGDSIHNFEKGTALLSSRIESLETAHDGSVWMTNNSNIIKYDPSSDIFSTLSGREGMTNVTFAIMSSAALSSGELAFGANKGLVIIDPSTMDPGKKEIKVFAFYRDKEGAEIPLTSGKQIRLKHKQQNVRLNFAVNDMMIADQILYKYRITGRITGEWSDPSMNPNVDFNLNPGNYIIEVEAFDGHGWVSLAAPVRIRITPPWWRQWWALSLFFFVILAGVWAYYRSRIRKYKAELIITRQISDLEAKALRAQMNPHFVFNSLNAIQECIVTGRVDEAYTYLSKFSRLLRLVLEHSDIGEVILQEELEVLDLYIALEKLRFKNGMHYQFELDSELDPEEIWIPPMLIQPHLENAIWHGLRHKDGEKNLILSIKETIPDYLEVIIQDDGVGRKRSASMNMNRLGGTKHQSKGKQLSENRMELLRNTYPLASMSITDLYDDDGEATGTKVVLMIPMMKKKL